MVKTHPVPLTVEEKDNLLNVAMDNDFYYMLFYVALTTGRRIGEYYGVYNKETKQWDGGVKVSDIDFEKNLMTTWVLKRRMRIRKDAILTPDAARLIKQYIQRHGLKLDDYLFRKQGYRNIQKKVRQYAKKANIPHNVSFHNFRHYFITYLRKQNWDYGKIALLTGHSNPAIISVYDHMVSDDIRNEALETLKGM